MISNVIIQHVTCVKYLAVYLDQKADFPELYVSYLNKKIGKKEVFLIV